MSNPQTCDHVTVDQFLRGELSQSLEADFTAHLDACEDCRQQLEIRAAEPDDWKEASSFLSTGEFNIDDEIDVRSGGEQLPLQIRNVLDALSPTDDPAMLGRMGGYEVSGVIGSGGMGVVLKAFDKSLDRTIAIKVMSPHLASSSAGRQRFEREGKAAAAVIHPNVVAIHSVASDNGLPYLVMPYNRGASLQKRIDHGSLSVVEIVRIAAQIASGLAAAHAQGLVHRDIKPANILLEEGVERVSITDFGLARAVDDATMTRSGVIAGTPQYMSPEQARGESIDSRSDLFSLGSLIYTMCAGQPPFVAETSFGILRRITDEQPTPIRKTNPHIPEWLCRIVRKLHSKLPADRYASATDVERDLNQCLQHLQTSDGQLPTWLRRRQRTGRTRLYASAAALAVAAACTWAVLRQPTGRCPVG